MSYSHSRRRRGSKPALSAVDKPASPAEQAFAVLTVATMLIVSATIVLM